MIEAMGVFNLSWEEKVIDAMRDIVPKEIPLSSRIINSLHTSYLAAMRRGYKPPLFVNRTIDNNGVLLVSHLKKTVNADPLIAKAFMYGLYTQSRAGKIPFSKYDPSGVETEIKLAKSYESEKGFIDKAGKIAASYSTKLLLIGGMALAAYIIFTKRTLTNG